MRNYTPLEVATATYVAAHHTTMAAKRVAQAATYYPTYAVAMADAATRSQRTARDAMIALRPIVPPGRTARTFLNTRPRLSADGKRFIYR